MPSQIMMTASKFMVVAVFALALIFGTRWCILSFYSATFVPTDARGLQGQVLLTGPPSPSSHEEEAPAGTLAPQFQAVHASRGR